MSEMMGLLSGVGMFFPLWSLLHVLDGTTGYLGSATILSHEGLCSCLLKGHIPHIHGVLLEGFLMAPAFSMVWQHVIREVPPRLLCWDRWNISVVKATWPL